MAENKLPKRKLLRLQGFDYSEDGAYFITVCTKEKRPLFGPMGTRTVAAQTVERAFLEIISHYRGVGAPIYVVMPNHFHAIITVSRGDTVSAPTVSQVIQAFKRYSTILYAELVRKGLASPFDKQLWQRSFYDHIIRNDDDYYETFKYIEENPLRWEKDRLYIAGPQSNDRAGAASKHRQDEG